MTDEPRNELPESEVPGNQELTLISVPAELPFAVELNKGETDRAAEVDVTAGAFIGRYRIQRQLGRGGFGVVYLAHDSELDRPVAIKLPHLHRVQDDDDRRMYLTEARTLARLDHPSIVPVYDFGVIPDRRCFVVSKYIDGKDLSRLIANERLEIARVVKLLATVADALDHVHEAKLIHRDIKPGNLLVGTDGRIYVADFGLAMRESSQVLPKEMVGTLSYMSPEQVRGEGHRMDGRSDQFSLGCVMYELLTGSRPFAGANVSETLSQLLAAEPRPPRELNSDVPRELSRICLKLLSKFPTQRYAKTRELAEDLRHWLATSEAAHVSAAPSNLGVEAAGTVTPVGTVTPRPHGMDVTLSLKGTKSQPKTSVTIIPRGLRAFSREDAYFFLSLLPGTRDRDGLPTSLNHWRQWASHRNEDDPAAHRVGVISGPTGCGKSSFVRAGVLPILDPSIVPVIVEASVDLTERQLAAGIDRRCSEHIGGSLADTLAAIRRGGGLDESKSLLIVIDQFEQWLHAHPDPQDTELVRAIRQCDGNRVRCLILVRDDFWLALNRFMEVVEAPVMLGRNALMVDLFDLRHAKKVLIEFGRAFGRLPLEPAKPSREQDRFLDEALSNLAVEGKVIPVRLTLFAEMVKSREWLPDTLRQMGGAVGIGEQFLAESFSATYAPANQRRHEPAARRVLQSLLPAIGTEIKASRRPRSELMAIAGCGDDRPQFEELMAILETDLKLITATETLDRSTSVSGSVSHSGEQTAYQLSHDFLVPSIRDWLSSRQRETFRGRLHERLTEQTALWSRQREARFLPNLFEWLSVRCFVPSRTMSPAERTMLAVKDRFALASIAGVLLVVATLSLGFREYQQRSQAHSLVEQLRTASISTARSVADLLAPYQRIAGSELTAAIAKTEPGSEPWFVMHVTQLQWHPENAGDVFEWYLDAPTESVPLVVESLSLSAKRLKDRCWTLLKGDQHPEARAIATDERRFRAAQLLATIDPPATASDSLAKWNSSAEFIARHLVQSCVEHPDQYALLADSLRPVTPVLIGPLSKCLGAAESIESRISLSLLAKYAADNRVLRTRLALDAAPWQWKMLMPPTADLVAAELWAAVRRPLETTTATESPDASIADSRRMSMAAALLLTLPDPGETGELWTLLKRAPKPDVRHQLIHHLHALNVPPTRLISRLRLEGDPDITSALLMALGEYPPDDPAISGVVKVFVRDQFRNDPDAGVHSSAEWLLRRWSSFVESDRVPVASHETRPPEPRPPHQWVQTPEGHTFVVVHAAEELGREFLVTTKEVSVEQYRRFNPHKYHNAEFSPSPDCPTNCVTWAQALAYCNWLSQQDGVPEDQWCYPRDESGYASWTPNAELLNRTGYRLPTWSEWLFVCRTGTRSRASFGDDLNLMGHYAWFKGNMQFDENTGRLQGHTQPCGLKLPNDWGLFDLYGNVSEWCGDVGEFHPNERALGGYSLSASAPILAANKSGSYVPTVVFDSIGFRVVRTVKVR